MTPSIFISLKLISISFWYQQCCCLPFWFLTLFLSNNFNYSWYESHLHIPYLIRSQIRSWYFACDYFTHLRVFHTSVSQWLFTRVCVTISHSKSPGRFLVFWLILIMWSFGWSPLVLFFPTPLVSLSIFSALLHGLGCYYYNHHHQYAIKLSSIETL